VNFANAWLPAVGDIITAIAWCRKDMIMMSTPHRDTGRRGNLGDL
jgi:hypothetical protein